MYPAFAIVPSPTTWCCPVIALSFSLFTVTGFHAPLPKVGAWYWGFAHGVQARRSYPAESSSLPTDRRFTSGCSPRHLAVTQLPSITSLRTSA
jgi:hypothetical protein